MKEKNLFFVEVLSIHIVVACVLNDIVHVYKERKSDISTCYYHQSSLFTRIRAINQTTLNPQNKYC
jgi:hypothetical protein